MGRYYLYGCVCSSDIELYECQEADASGQPEFTIEKAELEGELAKIAEIKKKSEAEGSNDRYFRLNYDGRNVLYIEQMGCICVEADDKIGYNVKDTSDPVFHQWLLCWAATTIIIRKQTLVLHGAGLLVPGTDDAIVLSGVSGAGKSTIANELLKAGMGFISDDSVRISPIDGDMKVIGSYKQRRLCTDVVNPDEYDMSKLRFYEEGKKTKWMMNVEEGYFGNEPHHFSKLVILEQDDSLTEPEIVEIRGGEMLQQLFSCLYKYKTYQAMGFSKKLFMEGLQAASQIGIFVVRRSFATCTSKQVAELILKDVLHFD